MYTLRVNSDTLRYIFAYFVYCTTIVKGIQSLRRYIMRTYYNITIKSFLFFRTAPNSMCLQSYFENSPK